MVSLKLESEQVTGSFKARGALNKILSLDTAQQVVTASSGYVCHHFKHDVALQCWFSPRGRVHTAFLSKPPTEQVITASSWYAPSD